MSNDSNKNGPKPTHPPTGSTQHSSNPPEESLDDQVFDLSSLEDSPISSLDTPRVEPVGVNTPLDPPNSALSQLSASLSIKSPEMNDDPSSMTIGIPIGGLPDFVQAPLSGDLTADSLYTTSSSESLELPIGGPLSSAKLSVARPDSESAIPLDSRTASGSSVITSNTEDSANALGNFESIVPVAPASGWLSAESELPPPIGDASEVFEPLGVHQADLFDAPPAIESSDIFSTGPIPNALNADQSDVIAATANAPEAEAIPGTLGRPSEIALNFDQPPGGSTIYEEGGSADLPIAEEVIDLSPESIDYASLAETPVKSAEIPKAGVREDTVEYGAMSIASPDASSILSDLSDPGDIVIDESSSVRLEAPGVGRTFSTTSDSGTEFDLTISEDPIFPELDEAAASSGTETVDWQQQSGSDLFEDRRTSPEIDLDEEDGRVSPIDVSLSSDEPSLTSSPSSIFSDGRLPVVSPGNGAGSPGSDSVRIGRPTEDEDAAVEFSDHPSADPESASVSALASKNLSEDKESTQPRKSVEQPLSKRALDDRDGGHVDWDAAAAPEDAQSTIGFPHALLDAPLSSILKRGASIEDSDESPATFPPAASTKNSGNPTEEMPSEGSDHSVEIDWMAGSSEESTVVPAEVYEQQPTATEKSKTKARKDSSSEKKRAAITSEPATPGSKNRSFGWVGGSLLGMAAATAACAGVYLAGLVPNSTATPKVNLNGAPGDSLPSQTEQVSKAEPQASFSVRDAQAAIHSGDAGKALTMLSEAKVSQPDHFSPEAQAALGQARLFARVQSLARENAPSVSPEDPELKRAQAELKAVIDDPSALKSPGGELAAAKATLHLGLAYELANDRDRARTIYEEGLKKLPRYSGAFQAAIDRLAATDPTAAEHSFRLNPADLQQLLFAVIIFQESVPAEGGDEAGMHYWKAVNLAHQGKYGDAIEEIKKAKGIHLNQARLNAGRGLNPLSDPLEQIFPRSCDDLKSYWELRAAIYSNKTVADAIKKDGVEKTLSDLAAAQKKATEAVKAIADLREATDKLAKAQKDLKETQESLALLEKQSVDREAQTKVELVKIQNKLKSSQMQLMEAEDKFLANDAALKKTAEVNAAIARELQKAKLLGQPYDSQELLAAQKTALDRASGPNLSTLLPPGMMTIAGGGLSSAHLMDLAARVAKSNATAKQAEEKLAAETKRLTTEQEIALRNIKESHAAEIKKLTDGYTAEMKKAMDAYAASAAKVKEEQLAQIKKMADTFAAEVKKLSDDNATALKAIKGEYEAKLIALDAAVAREKAAGEAALARLRIDIKNSVSPAQTLDLWLPQLSELRRPADAQPALATARNVLEASAPDSETAAKAHTVAGLANLLQGELSTASKHFDQARSSPAYKTAAGKEWTRAADMGFASITDPLAVYRQPVEKPRRDVKLAASLLDIGVQQFKSGRYLQAQDALVKSTQADSSDPVAWYFLGATRWALGAENQAREDYRQGAEREKSSVVPARILNEFLEPIQGSARDALTVVRP